MIVFFLQVTLLLAVSLLAMAFARRHPALRLAIARVTLLAVLGLSIASPRIQERKHPTVPVTFTVSSVVPEMPKLPVVMATPMLAQPSQGGNPNVSEPPTASGPPIDPEQLVSLAWGLGTILLGINLLLGYATLACIRRNCRPAQSAVLKEVAQTYGLRVPRLMEGDAVSNPFVAGIVRPTVFLPSHWLASQDEPTQRAVLQHEVAHIANGDLRWGLLYRLQCIGLWPLPLLWVLRRPMASAEEELCDRHVLAAGIPDHLYADCLLRLREGLKARPCPSLGIGAVSRRSSLGRRIEAILDRGRSRSVSLSRTATNATRLGVLALGLIVAVSIARPTAVRTDLSPKHQDWSSDPRLNPYQIKLSNGITLQAEYVRRSDLTSKLEPWLPDGTPDAQLSPSDAFIHTGFEMWHQPKDQAFLKINLRGSGSTGFSHHTRAPHASCASSENTCLIQLDMSRHGAIDVPIGIGAGPFQLVARSKYGQGPIFPEIDSRMSEINKPTLWIRGQVPPTCRGKDVVLIAIDHQGQEIHRLGGTSEYAPKIESGFQRTNLANIDHFELRVRDIEWGTIHNVYARPTVSNPKPGSAFGPFHLKSGETVELLGVREMNTGLAWKPDGTPSNSKEIRWPGLPPSGDKEGLDLAVQVKNLRSDRILYRFRCSRGPGYAEGPIDTASSAPIVLPIELDLTRKDRVTDVMFGLPGPIRTIASCRFGEAPLFAKSLKEVPDQGRMGPGVLVEYTNPKAAAGKYMEIVPVNAKGESPAKSLVPHTLFEETIHPVRGQYLIQLGTIGAIDHFEVRVRDFEWVKFSRIHLSPR